MGCGNSKIDTANVAGKLDNNKEPIKDDNKSGINRKENEYLKTDERARKFSQDVTETGNGNSKQDTCHDPEEIEKENAIFKDDNKNGIDLKDTGEHQEIDQHARKAPKSLKNSAEELVEYLSLASTDPRMLVRGFFVWISENIRYDVDGYFGKANMAPTDAESVMRNGRSVCAGYAEVFKLLCSKAGIPVKKLSGFAKGYRYSLKQPFTLDTKTNHAWNAVQLEGKWYLLDCTWGTGYVDSNKDFKKAFKEFYFLTEPKQFLTAHFPYMDNNLQESKKWQLLANPLSLDEFNKSIKYDPQAFKLGVQAVSHTQPYFEMKNELKMTFKSVGKEEIELTAALMYEEGNNLKKERNATYWYEDNGCYKYNDVFKILVHPRKTGMYTLNIFGKLASDENHVSSYIMEYKFKCTEVTDKNHEYPVVYGKCSTEKCFLHEPLRGNLPSKTNIQFCISAPHLQQVMISNQGNTYLNKQGTMFRGTITTPEKGHKVNMFGARDDKFSSMKALYGFHTI